MKKLSQHPEKFEAKELELILKVKASVDPEQSTLLVLTIVETKEFSIVYIYIRLFFLVGWDLYHHCKVGVEVIS
jgi:hypothetical protein